MPIRQLVYLVLALLGLVLPWYHNLAFARETGAMDMGAFVAGVFANHASSSIGWDITIGCAAFLTFASTEAKRLGMKHLWLYFVLTFGVAFAFAAPMFLFMRERALARHRDAA